jgi:hypothetical protein
MTKLINLASLVIAWGACVYFAVCVFQSPCILGVKSVVIALLLAAAIAAYVGYKQDRKTTKNK